MWLFADDHATSTRTQALLYSRTGGDIAYTPLRTEDQSTFPEGGGGVHTLLSDLQDDLEPGIENFTIKLKQR